MLKMNLELLCRVESRRKLMKHQQVHGWNAWQAGYYLLLPVTRGPVDIPVDNQP